MNATGVSRACARVARWRVTRSDNASPYAVDDAVVEMLMLAAPNATSITVPSDALSETAIVDRVFDRGDIPLGTRIVVRVLGLTWQLDIVEGPQ